MRRTATFLLAVGLVLALAPAAGAVKPIFTPGEYFEVEVPFPDVCPDFEMVATVRGKPHAITFLDAAGNATRGHSAGQLSVTWMRTDTGFSRTFVISGPTFSDASGVAVRGTGRWTTPLDGTGWVLASGNLTFDGYTADGWSLIGSYHGRATSICDLMA